MSRSVCARGECTGCKACVSVCPKKCILTQKDGTGFFHMVIDEEKCIDCKRCERVCPNHTVRDFHYPLKAYAGWAVRPEIQLYSASGGVASAFYKYAVKHNMKFAGVRLDEKFEAHFRLGGEGNEECIGQFRNSKYTFSFMDDIYDRIKSSLKNGENVLFIGLPCQVAAMKNYADSFRWEGKLITVDIVCHGTPPSNYLQEHVRRIEEKKKHKYSRGYFRDALYGTDKFVFSLYQGEEKKPSYHKFVKEDDLFQIGYHKGYIYRENCYACKYARRERISDLTISDYWGEPLDDKVKQLSSILVNTDLGEEFLKDVCEDKLIVVHERELEEPFRLDKQLNHPSSKSLAREKFISRYIECQDYEKAARQAFGREARINKAVNILHVKQIKSSVTGILPDDLKSRLKKVLKR